MCIMLIALFCNTFYCYINVLFLTYTCTYIHGTIIMIANILTLLTNTLLGTEGNVTWIVTLHCYIAYDSSNNCDYISNSFEIIRKRASTSQQEVKP